MRVITGSLRGKKLQTLAGLDVRPTTDKVKEAIFSIVHFDLPGAKVLDLFAGSGQLGIEAISRGASSCVFVDRSKDAVAVVRKNVSDCKIDGLVTIQNCDSLDYLRSSKNSFDIAFLDPPYERGLVEKALALLEPKMNSGGIVVCEHESELELPEIIGRLRIRRKYSYGKKIALSVYQFEDGGNTSE